MLIILPPSETKAAGGTGAPLDLSTLSFPQLNGVREEIAADLIALPEEEALATLGISIKLSALIAVNQELFSAPTMPAIFRFTGVLFDALDATSLPPSALERLAVGDALFGLLKATDQIPNYRLSGGTKLPIAGSGESEKPPTMKKRWGSKISEAIADYPGLVVDLRSGTYQQLGKAPGAVTVRVESVAADGSRKVVSHFNKHYKGLVARALALAETAPTSLSQVRTVLEESGMVIESTPDSLELTLVVEA
ncbi:MAG: peroxide stress protein YaaA [Corynebacterium sp.]|uniref:peroxide stress protein YaaA n=1 Tax=Corynebacterium sp. TaxID=1720 RepID=UPI0026DBE2A1|nr:peroxide stress protein YaaA [Corynebacterium sp.]MDO5098005.1 peroxide stress protein YaaA [Corynebacterium sp.]